MAEELHFSRAAARVFLTQQALSRQIKELEDELGVQLFDRTTRRVSLTVAGEVFYEASKGVIASFDDAVAAARRTTRALSGKLRLGFIPAAALELTPLIIAAFQEAHPEVEVEMREFPAIDPSAGLITGATDVAFIRLPQATPRIETETMFLDPVIAMVAAGHPLAARTSVPVAELVRETLTLSDTPDEVYKAFWSLAAARDATAGRLLPVVSVTEEASLVANGAAVAVTSSAAQSFVTLPGVRHVPIEDWPPSEVVVAWHEGERSALVASFVRTACEVRDAQPDLVRLLERRA
ncbi:LysR family transcriptional regulator [Nocardioides baekrokdamisoli]|uniref:LysR family transcriptional regulator n=1 Tax=Nocardioides baekrokdamisoli TaxID=1804624 RepID=A0A3G9ICS8_9ACTN|nr:LysR family transcriptional regulator [Nocardioides baekrokdamisoli]